MAEAIESLYPGIKFGIGPAIENGFYYDVDPGDGKVITEADLLTIENKMKELAAKNLTYSRKDVSKKEAMDLFTKKGDEYKTELISELEDGTISFIHRAILLIFAGVLIFLPQNLLKQLSF